MINDTSSLQCRTATKQDLSDIVALLADDVLGTSRESIAPEDFPIYEQAFDEMTAQLGNEILVAENSTGIVGVLQLTIISGVSRLGTKRAQIEGVRVHESYRGKGVGKWLIAQACDRAKAAGCRLIQLTTDKRRTEARGFYERAGFIASHEGMKKEI